MPGLARAQSMTPLQRLHRLQESGLAECGGAGEPIHLAWRQFLRGRGPSVLVIDATGLDAHARGPAAVLDGAPWLLAEGVLIAVGLRDSLKVELRLPAELNGREAAFLNAVDSIRSLAQVAIPRRQVEVLRDCRPGCWGEGRPADASRLIHSPETWCRIALLFAGRAGPRRVAADAPARPRAARPRRAPARGQPAGARSRRWGGGDVGQSGDALLVFDDGMGGFLPLSASDLVMRPAVSRVGGRRPGAVHPHGHGGGRLRRQADRARGLPALAARRRRRRPRYGGPWRARRA